MKLKITAINSINGKLVDGDSIKRVTDPDGHDLWSVGFNTPTIHGYNKMKWVPVKESTIHIETITA